MKEIIFLVEESLDGGYEARVLGHPIFTQAETMVDLRVKVLDSVQCHFDDGETPTVIRIQ